MGNEIFLYLISGKNNFVARVDPRTRFQIGDQVRWSSTWTTSTCSILPLTARTRPPSAKLVITRSE
jgi:hypothetical protein